MVLRGAAVRSDAVQPAGRHQGVVGLHEPVGLALPDHPAVRHGSGQGPPPDRPAQLPGPRGAAQRQQRNDRIHRFQSGW